MSRNEYCEIDGNLDVFTRARDLATAFNWWYVDTGRGDAWGSRTLANQFKDKAKLYRTPEGHGFTPNNMSDTGYAGIRLRDDFQRQREDRESANRYRPADDILCRRPGGVVRPASLTAGRFLFPAPLSWAGQFRSRRGSQGV